MTEYLTETDVLKIAEEVLGAQPLVRDYGLISSAIARPSSSMFGMDPYPDIWTKAVALGESISRNHALIDGNKRTAWASMRFFLAINDVPVGVFSIVEAEDFILRLATGGYADDIKKGAQDLEQILT